MPKQPAQVPDDDLPPPPAPPDPATLEPGDVPDPGDVPSNAMHDPAHPLHHLRNT
jgi:hypothetical protein